MKRRAILILTNLHCSFLLAQDHLKQPLATGLNEQEIASWTSGAWAILLYVVIGATISFFIARHIYNKKTSSTPTNSTLPDSELVLLAQELYTPLSYIIGPLKEIVGSKELSTELSKQAKLAYHNAICIEEFREQLTHLYKNGKQSLEVAPYEPNKIADIVIYSFYDLLNSSSITLHYEKNEEITSEIWIDRKKIEFALRTMFANTYRRINYFGDVCISTGYEKKNDQEYCFFIISDGSNQAALKDEKELPSKEQGFELIKDIIQMHHGEVTVTHRENNSTEITLHIPMGMKHFANSPNVTFIKPEELVVEEIPPTENTSTDATYTGQAVPSVTASGRSKLLIIEDHKDIRLYLKVLFAQEYTLFMAENGEEGLKIARKELPNLIISDVMMPMMDGFECCKRLKEDLKTCHIPVIMLTALTGDEEVMKGIEIGADDYILKPFNPEILKTKVKRLIQSRLELKHIYTRLLMPTGTLPEEENTETDETAEDPLIAQILQIVKENLQNPDFSVKKLSEMLNMSQPTLYRRVKQTTNFTIIELVRGVRLKRSAELLKTRQYSVQEVAEMVGYNDIPTFRKHFVDFYGTTPSTFGKDEGDR